MSVASFIELNRQLYSVAAREWAAAIVSRRDRFHRNERRRARDRAAGRRAAVPAADQPAPQRRRGNHRDPIPARQIVVLNDDDEDDAAAPPAPVIAPEQVPIAYARDERYLSLRVRGINADMDYVRALPAIIAADDIEGVCTQCQDDMEGGQKLRTLGCCLAMFHVDCVDHWLLRERGTCPACNQPLPNVRPVLGFLDLEAMGRVDANPEPNPLDFEIDQ